MRDIPNLDVVRSIAVLTVVVEHFLLASHIYYIGPFEVEWFGVLGVMLFFVLTSLVLMWSLERKPHTLDFYIRRIFRIYPLALLMLAVVPFFHIPVGGSVHNMVMYNEQTGRRLLWQATLMPGVDMTVMTVMWSLPIEVGMYLLLPMLFFYVRRNFSLWPLLVLWCFTVWLTRGAAPHVPFFGVMIPFFLPGLMAYVGFNRWKARLPGLLLPLALIPLWLATWYHCSFHRGYVFCLAVGLMLPFFRQISSSLILAPSRLIARYSYGIYLTHPFVVLLWVRGIAGWPLLPRVVTALLALSILPVLLYHLVEHPMIRIGSRLANRVEKKYEQHEYGKLHQTPASL